MMSLKKLASMVIRMSELKEKIDAKRSTYLEQIEMENLRGKLAKIRNTFETKQGVYRENTG